VIYAVAFPTTEMIRSDASPDVSANPPLPEKSKTLPLSNRAMT
jgi:hypothetical protein